MWVDLPDGTDVAAMFDAAAARGVRSSRAPTSSSKAASRSLRLAYSGRHARQIEEGVRRLAEAYAEVAAPAHAA